MRACWVRGERDCKAGGWTCLHSQPPATARQQHISRTTKFDNFEFECEIANERSTCELPPRRRFSGVSVASVSVARENFAVN